MIEFFKILFIGLVLSIDSFSAACALGNKKFSKSRALFFALSSGLSESGFTFLGAVFGGIILSRFSEYDHWIAFFLLFFLSIHHLYETFSEKGKEDHEVKVAHGAFKILLISFATSIDALAVGIVLSKTNWLSFYLLSIGLWATIATLVGIKIGNKLSNRFGFYMNIFGAIVLFILALTALKI